MVIFHKQLDVYRVSLEFVSQAGNFVKHIPKGQAFLGDQLQRAATSIVFNLSEGAGEFSKRKKIRFYRMALRSAAECAAIIDVLLQFKIVTGPDHRVAESYLDRIMGMLTKLIHRHASTLD